MIKEMNRGGGIKDVEVRKVGPEVFANLTRDAGFKIVLGTEGQSEELLKKLLNRLLPEAGIVDLQYLPTEHFGTTEDDGKSVFDVYCKDRGGSRFLVEMQMWLYSLKNMYLLEKQPGGVEGTELEELYKEAYMARWSPEKKDIYKVLMTKEEEMRNIMREHEEDAFNDGLAVGREEGREEGRINTIRRLLESGMSMDMIAQALNLTEDERRMLI